MLAIVCGGIKLRFFGAKVRYKLIKILLLQQDKARYEVGQRLGYGGFLIQPLSPHNLFIGLFRFDAVK